MKKALILCILAIFLSGCTTYKFKQGLAPYGAGYVVTRDEKAIPEYTVGKDNATPVDLKLAEERFQRRKEMVDYYYQKMGTISNRVKETFVDYPVNMGKLVTGVFRLPFIARSEYKYEHDPKYREMMDKKEEEEETREKERIKKYQAWLDEYIQKDLELEVRLTELKPKPKIAEVMTEQKAADIEETQPAPMQVEEKPAAQAAPPQLAPAEVKPLASEKVTEKQEAVETALEAVAAEQKAQTPAEVTVEPGKKEVKPAPAKKSGGFLKWNLFSKKEKPKENKEKRIYPDEEGRARLLEPKALIMAKPVKGISPLKVRFWGTRSYSPGARIVGYSWDFGDGDTSTRPNPLNTFYSASFEPRKFTVNLTVTDSRGKTASSSMYIVVLNK
jgi:hypothetical protein